MLSVRKLSKSFSGPRSKTVLRDIGFELAAGDYVAVMGESGIGKSTLLNLIAGLERPDSGRDYVCPGFPASGTRRRPEARQMPR